MMRHARLAAIVLASFVFASRSALAISIGQIDDFQDGTTLLWGGGAMPMNIADGGPAGAGDRYLEISSTGGNLGTVNADQWAGDYLSAGVTGIAADLANFGQTPLEIRLLLPTGPGGNFTSAAAQVIPADGQWRQVLFSLTSSDMVRVGGSGTLDATLTAVPRLLIRHDPGAPDGPGAASPVVGALGLDNLHAVPEPTSALLAAIGALAIIIGWQTGRFLKSRVSRVGHQSPCQFRAILQPVDGPESLVAPLHSYPVAVPWPVQFR